jgi:hypothetical protein
MNFNDVVWIGSVEVAVSAFFIGMCFYLHHKVAKEKAVWFMVAWMIYLGALPVFNNQLLSYLDQQHQLEKAKAAQSK